MVWILTILTQGLMASKTRIGTLIFSNIIQFYVSWKARSPMAFLIYSKKRLGFCWASQDPVTCWPGQWCNFRGETFKFPVLGHKLGLIQFLLKFIDFGSHGAGSRQQSQLKASGPGLWLNIPVSQFLIRATARKRVRHRCIWWEVRGDYASSISRKLKFGTTRAKSGGKAKSGRKEQKSEPTVI